MLKGQVMEKKGGGYQSFVDESVITSNRNLMAESFRRYLGDQVKCDFTIAAAYSMIDQSMIDQSIIAGHAVQASTYISYIPPWLVQSIMLSVFSAEKLMGESVSDSTWWGVWLGSNLIVFLLFSMHIYKKCQGESGLSYDMRVFCSEEYYLGYGIYLIELIYSAIVLLILNEISPESSLASVVYPSLNALYHLLYLKLSDEYQDLAILKQFIYIDSIKIHPALATFRSWKAWLGAVLKLTRFYNVFPCVISDALEGRHEKAYPLIYFSIYLMEKLCSASVFHEFFKDVVNGKGSFLEKREKGFLLGFGVVLFLQILNVFSDDFYDNNDSIKLTVFLSLQVCSDFLINKALKTQYRREMSRKPQINKNEIYIDLSSACGCSCMSLDFLQAFYEVFQYGSLIVATYLWTSSDDIFQRYISCATIILVYLITLGLNQKHISEANEKIEKRLANRNITEELGVKKSLSVNSVENRVEVQVHANLS